MGSTTFLIPQVASAQQQDGSAALPDWVKNIFVWYGQGQVSEKDVLNAIKFLAENDIIKIQTESKESMKSGMSGSGMMGMMTGDNMPFNPEMPITIPMIDGYHEGNKVFFIHTEVSDEKMARMMSMMINFPTISVSELHDIPVEKQSKVYVFTNGIAGKGPYGGGPFMFQIDIFDSVPGKDEYTDYRVPHLVTWKEDSVPRLLTSESEVLQAESDGELTIEKTDMIVHAPMIVWYTDDKTRNQAEHLQTPFDTMREFDTKVVNIDEENYSTTLHFHPKGSMEMSMMN